MLVAECVVAIARVVVLVYLGLGTVALVLDGLREHLKNIDSSRHN